MTEAIFDYEGKETKEEMQYLKISASSLNSFQLCPRHFYYDKVKNLITLETSERMESGDLMHKMLASYYQSFIDSKARDHNGRVEDAVIAGFNHAASLNLDPTETMYQFREYCSFYEGENIEPIAVEQTFCEVLAVLSNLTILYEGIIDLIYLAGPQRIETICDHKTETADRKGTALDNQFMGYSWYTGISNVVKNKIGFQKTYPREKRFIREMLSYEKPIVDEWVNNTIYHAQQIMAHLSADFFPQNFTSCTKYGICKYESLCNCIPGARENRVKMNYRVREARE